MSEEEKEKKIGEINSISVGSPEQAFYAVGYFNIHKIKEEVKFIGTGYYNNISLVVYRCYDDKENLLCEISSNLGIVISYKIEGGK